MNKFKSIFYLFLVTGLFSILLGIYMFINEKTSGGFTYTRYGKSGTGEINGLSAIIIGLLVLFLSLVALNQAKINQAEREKLFPNSKKRK